MKLIKYTYLASAVYDFILGAVFLMAPAFCFNIMNITPPNHWGYVTFAALMLMIFGIMFFKIFQNIQTNKNLIPYSILLKTSYCGTVFGYALFSSIPFLWVLFGIFDFLFLLIFIYAWIKIK